MKRRERISRGGWSVGGPVPGDYNGDGVVNAADYVFWRDTLGKTVAPGSGADGDHSGTIDAGDYTVWKQNFGDTNGSGSALSTAVPEPATLWLLAIGIGIAWGRRLARQPLLAVALLAISTASAHASATPDRLYLFGDDNLENGTAGQSIGINTDGYTYDSVGDITTGMSLPGAFIDLQANGGILYSSLTYPGAPANSVSASFDGIDDYLRTCFEIA